MSVYKLFAIGLAKHDIEPHSVWLDIIPTEYVGSHTEDIDADKKKYDKKKKSKTNSITSSGIGGAVMGSAEKTNTIKARWLNRGSNRVTAPTIYQGETVKIYKFGQTDRYYWEPFHLEKDLRRKEVSVIAFSNRDKKKDEDFGKHFDEKTSYYFKVDTINKVVKFKTATNDKEPAGYNIEIDTKKGTLTIEDTKKNKIHLDSVAGNLTFDINNSITMNTKHVNINAKSDVTINTPKYNLKGGNSKIEHTTECTKPWNHKANVKFNAKSFTNPDKCPCCGKKHKHSLE